MPFFSALITKLEPVQIQAEIKIGGRSEGLFFFIKKRWPLVYLMISVIALKSLSLSLNFIFNVFGAEIVFFNRVLWRSSPCIPGRPPPVAVSGCIWRWPGIDKTSGEDLIGMNGIDYAPVFRHWWYG